MLLEGQGSKIFGAAKQRQRDGDAERLGGLEVQGFERTCRPTSRIAKIAKPTIEISDKVRLNLEKFV